MNTQLYNSSQFGPLYIRSQRHHLHDYMYFEKETGEIEPKSKFPVGHEYQTSVPSTIV